MKTSTLCAAIAAILIVGCTCAPSFALNANFENGSDWGAIGSSIPGLTFSTPGGGSVYCADINDADWPFKSDNGKNNPDWEYYIAGDFAAISADDNLARIAFSSPKAYFRVGYSSYFPFVLDAYDSSDTLLASVTGARNSRTWGGDGLSYLAISNPGISYVQLHASQGSFPAAGYWVVDNINLVPEPSSIVVLAGGLGFLGMARRCLVMRRKQ